MFQRQRRDPPNLRNKGRVIAHRGASRTAPENTIAAFRAALDAGTNWFEFDVSLLGDRTPVIHHDATLERCTNAVGSLIELRRGDLAGIDAGSKHSAIYAGEPLPLLDDVLDLIETEAAFANLEIKPHQTDARTNAEAVAHALAMRSWSRERIIVSSFDLATLAEFRDLLPDHPVAVLTHQVTAERFREAEQLDAAALHLNYRALTNEVLEHARREGRDIRVYTVNQPEIMVPFRDIGLTSVITDLPELFLEDPDWKAWAAS